MATSAIAESRTAEQQSYASTNPFFAHPIEQPIPIVGGIIEERQVGFLAGHWALGKTPLYIQMALCIVSGQQFLGQPTTKRPVIILDAESNYNDFRLNTERIANRLYVSPEDMKDFIPILRYGPFDDPLSQRFQHCLGDEIAMMDFINTQLNRYPNALVVLDPLLEIFPIADSNKDGPVMELYNKFRDSLYQYPHASFNVSLHLRKSRSNERTEAGGFATAKMLMNHRRQALQEVAGSNKFGAHADSRFMLAPIDDDEEQLLLAGFIRGKTGAEIGMERSQIEPSIYDGFIYKPEAIATLKAPLPEAVQKALRALPRHFRFGDLIAKGVPRSSLSRYLNAGRKAGVVRQTDGVYTNTLGSG